MLQDPGKTDKGPWEIHCCAFQELWVHNCRELHLLTWLGSSKLCV